MGSRVNALSTCSFKLSITDTNRTMKPLSSVLVLCLCANGLSASAEDALRINVLEGHGVAVTAVSHRGADIRLRVTDTDNKPIQGAIVSAILPAIGAGGHFSGGSTIASKETNSDGTVEFSGIRLRDLTGDFTTNIRARKGDRTGSAQVTQKVSMAPAAEEGPWSRRRVLMVAIAAAGVTAGVLAAILGDSSGGAPASALTVTPGSPITGGPR
jgi:hypothetical protein